MRRTLHLLFIVAMMLAGTQMANAQVQLSINNFPSNEGYVVGDTVRFELKADSSFTGLNALAMTMRLTYNNDYMRPINTDLSGTLLGVAGWSVNPNLTVDDVITIAGAGATALADTGSILFIDFELVRQGTGYLYYDQSNTFFNEGTDDIPLMFKSPGYGYVSIGPKPTINAYFPGTPFVIGDSLNATVSGAEAPVSWSVTNPALAEVDSIGKVKAKGYGKVGIIAVDNRGVRDTVNITILGFRLSAQDTTNYKGQIVSVPISTSDLTGLNIISGEFKINTTVENRLEILSVEKGDMLDPGASVAYNAESDGIKLSFAQTTPLSGSGQLFVLNMRLQEDQTFNNYATFSNPVFNEDINGTGTAFWVVSRSLPDLTISFIAQNQYLVGDSLEFSASNNTGPVNWMVSDTSLANINSNGLLRSKKGGTFTVIATDSIGASKTTAPFTFYDTVVEFPDSSMLILDTLYYPIRIKNLENTSSELISAEITFSFNQNQINYLGYSTTSSLMSGWSVNENQLAANKVKVVAAGANPITRSGDLLYVKFKVDTSISVDTYTNLTINDVVLNEGNPNFLTDNGRIFISTKPLTPVLTSPTNGSSDVTTDVTLDWEIAVGAEYYAVQLSTSSSFTANVLDTIGVVPSQIAATNLNNDDRYYWRVKALNSSGESSWSSYFYFDTEDPIPATPSLTSPDDAITGLTRTPVLSWTEVAYAHNYRVEVSTQSDFSTLLVDSTLAHPTNSMQLDTLNYLTKYYWRVFANNTTGESAPSISRTFTTIIEIPETTTLLTPSDGSIDIAVDSMMTWSQAARAANYKVQIAKISDFSSIYTDTLVTDTVFTPSLDFETSYFWRVQPMNASGSSAWSSTFSLTTAEPVDLAPVIILPLSDIVLDEDFGTTLAVILTDHFSDPEGDSLQFEIVSSTHLLSSSIQTDSLILESVQDSSGSGDIIIKAMDVGGQVVHDTLTVTINSVNDLPFVIALPDTISYTNDQEFKLDISTAFGDVEDSFDDLTITVSVDESSVTASITATDSLKLLSTTYSGLTSLNFVVEDTDGGILNVRIVLEIKMATSNEMVGSAPDEFSLDQNYPNPFNPSSNIRFGLPKSGEVRLDVYNLLGQQVATLVNQKMQAGWHTVTFDASGLSSGTYIYRITAGDFVQTKKMMLIK